MPTMNISKGFPSRLGAVGMPILLQATLVVACLAPIPALAQRDMGCSPTVANPCTGGRGGNSGAEAAGARAGAWLRCRMFGGSGCPDETSPADQAREQRRSEALAANRDAIQFQNKGDWARAVALFQEAANKDPSDPIIQQNLANARQGLARAEEEQAKARTEAQQKASAERMSKSIQDLAQSFSAAPTASGPASGGLDFDGSNAAVSPAGGSSPNVAKGAGGGLDFTAVVATAPARQTVFSPANDPRVVDARNVRSGLAPAVDKAINGAFASAMPGVSDRVRKGFQAVTAGDWKVAEAWFADALNRDPDNAALKNMLAAARSSRAQAQAPQRVSPQGEIVDLYTKGWDAVATGDRAAAITALEAAISRDPSPGVAATTYVAYLRASVAAARQPARQLPAESDIQYLFPDSESPAPVAAKTPAQVAARPTPTPTPTPFLKLLLDALMVPGKPGKGVAAVRG